MMASRNGRGQDSVNRYLWVAGAVGTGACVAYWALARKEDRWTRTKRQCRDLAKATKKELEPWMSSAAENAEKSARFMKETLASGSKKVAASGPEIKHSTVEFLDALSDLWAHGRKLARSVQR
jgi:transposase